MKHLADRVRDERLRLRWSIRTAATAGGVSNTYWANFEERRQPLTDGIILAVAKAYGWESDWASQPDEFVLLQGRVAELEQWVGQLFEFAGIDAPAGLGEPQEPAGDEH